MNYNRKLCKTALTAACVLGVMAAKSNPVYAEDIPEPASVITSAYKDLPDADLTETTNPEDNAIDTITPDTTASDITEDNTEEADSNADVKNEADELDEADETDEAETDITDVAETPDETEAVTDVITYQTAAPTSSEVVIEDVKAAAPATHPYIANYMRSYNGVNYSAVYDYNYYINRYPDLWNAFGGDHIAAFMHFLTFGMAEGRMGNSSFDVRSYYNTYQDLRLAFRQNTPEYYNHYITYGQREGRKTTGVTTLQNPVTTINGVNYSAVYNYNTYISRYSDLARVFGSRNDDIGALEHFIIYGMKERRTASNSFDMTSYKWRYKDLRRAFGNNNENYYTHYIIYGQREGRNSTSGQTTMVGAPTSYDYYNFSGIFDAAYYYNRYSDLRRAFGDDDQALFMHFLIYGLSEGRVAKASYSASEYNALRPVGPSLINPVRSVEGIDFSSIYDYGYYIKNNPDVVKAFGYNSQAVFNHFLKYGMYEHRAGTPNMNLNAYATLKNRCIQAAVNEATARYRGYPYVWGGASPATSFDCSGLVNYVFNKYGVNLPRTAQQQYDSTTHIGWDQAAWGDLVFFTGTYNAGRYITHVEIYLGNNTSYGASTGGVNYHSVTNDPHLRGHFVCFGRIRRI